MWFWILLGLILLRPMEIMAVNSISPSFVEVNIGKSKSAQEVVVEISNNGNVDQTFDLSVVDFGTLDESGGIAFLSPNKKADNQRYSLASWIVLEKNVVIVAPEKKEKIKATIINKDSLVSGGIMEPFWLH